MGSRNSVSNIIISPRTSFTISVFGFVIKHLRLNTQTLLDLDKLLASIINHADNQAGRNITI